MAYKYKVEVYIFLLHKYIRCHYTLPRSKLPSLEFIILVYFPFSLTFLLNSRPIFSVDMSDWHFKFSKSYHLPLIIRGRHIRVNSFPWSSNSKEISKFSNQKPLKPNCYCSQHRRVVWYMNFDIRQSWVLITTLPLPV